MNKEAPILQRIQDKFDVYEQASQFAGDKVYKISIDSSPKGYEFVLYRGGYDGLKLSVQAEGGLFGKSGPKRVETSKDFGGAGFVDLSPSDTDNLATGKLVKPAEREGLILPGDEGFELFEELHEQVQEIKFPIELACDWFLPIIEDDLDWREPVIFKLKDEDEGYTRHKYGSRTHQKTSEYQIIDRRGRKVIAHFNADALIEEEDDEAYKEFENRYMYTNGGVRIEDGDAFDVKVFDPSTPLTSFFGDALSDFSYLHGRIEDLYLPQEPYEED